MSRANVGVVEERIVTVSGVDSRFSDCAAESSRRTNFVSRELIIYVALPFLNSHMLKLRIKMLFYILYASCQLEDQ